MIGKEIFLLDIVLYQIGTKFERLFGFCVQNISLHKTMCCDQIK